MKKIDFFFKSGNEIFKIKYDKKINFENIIVINFEKNLINNFQIKKYYFSKF